MQVEGIFLIWCKYLCLKLHKCKYRKEICLLMIRLNDTCTVIVLSIYWKNQSSTSLMTLSFSSKAMITTDLNNLEKIQYFRSNLIFDCVFDAWFSYHMCIVQIANQIYSVKTNQQNLSMEKWLSTNVFIFFHDHIWYPKKYIYLNKRRILFIEQMYVNILSFM